MKEKINVKIKLNQEMCFECKKISPEYFELKLQIRLKHFKNEELEKKTNEIKKLLYNYLYNKNTNNNILNNNNNDYNNNTNKNNCINTNESNNNINNNINKNINRNNIFKSKRTNNPKNQFIEKINKITYTNNGIDIFINDISLKNDILNLFKKNYLIESKLTKKITGRDFLNSKDVFKYTLLIRIYNLKKGNKITYKGENYVINSIFNNKISVISSSGKKLIITSLSDIALCDS